jgi:hypothetical protein
MLARSRNRILPSALIPVPTLRTPLVPMRTLKLRHLTPLQIQRSKEEQIPYVDYAILQREKSLFSHIGGDDHSITSLPHFFQTVRDAYSSNSETRQIKSLRRRRSEEKVEALFVLLLNSLHYSHVSGTDLDGYSSKIQSELVVYSGKKNMQGTSKRELFHNVRLLAGLYLNGNDEKRYGITKSSAPEALSNVTMALSLLLSLKVYEFYEVQNWIGCISALTVTDACFAVYGAYGIPLCILNDILMRVPKSKYEVELMIEIYQSLTVSKPLQFASIENIVHYIKIYSIESLPEFVDLLTSKQSLSEAELNKLMCLIADTSMTSFNLQEQNNKLYLTRIIQSQKFIYEKLLSKGKDLNNLGTLSISLSILPVSRERSKQLFKSIHRNDLIGKREIELYNILRLTLEESPNRMIEIIDSIIGTNELTFKVWNHFIISMNEYDTNLLRASNAKTLMKKYSGYPFISHSQNELQKKLGSVDEIISTFNGQSNFFDNRSISNVLRKLYDASSRSFDDPSPKSYTTLFASNISYARYIFSQISNPSMGIIGQVLLGESQLDPASAYERYVHYLTHGPSSTPNENFLKSLLIPSILNPRLKWQESNGSVRFSTQIAVHEFRQVYHISNHNTQESSSPSSTFPTNTLWWYFIMLCGRSNYQDELSEILPFWESINFTPSRKTLAMLLGALPAGNGEMIRKHAVTYLSHETQRALPGSSETEQVESQLFTSYPWPTTVEIEYWREKMCEETTDIKELMS